MLKDNKKAVKQYAQYVKSILIKRLNDLKDINIVSLLFILGKFAMRF